MNTQNYDPDEMFDSIDPENEALADLLQRARFNPTSAYQTDLWQRLQYRQTQQHERSYNGMSLSPWSNLSRLFLRFGLVGVTAAVSATIVVVVVLLGTLAFSPTARAQAQQLIARFVVVDSPEAFLAEQASKQQALLDGTQNSVTPAEASDTAAAGKGEAGQEGGNSVAPDASTTDKVTEPAEARPPRPAPAEGEDAALQMGGSQGREPEAGFTLPEVQGNMPPSLAASTSLEEAQSKASFDIRTPTWLPDGYALQGVMVPPGPASNLPQPAGAPQLPAAPAIATLNFSNDAGQAFVLSQMQKPQLNLPGHAPQEVLLPIPKDKASLQEVTINGQPGQYIQMNSGGGQLHWQDAAGVMYDLISDTLDQATLIRIAESIQ